MSTTKAGQMSVYSAKAHLFNKCLLTQLKPIYWTYWSIYLTNIHLISENSLIWECPPTLSNKWVFSFFFYFEELPKATSKTNIWKFEQWIVLKKPKIKRKTKCTRITGPTQTVQTGRSKATTAQPQTSNSNFQG